MTVPQWICPAYLRLCHDCLLRNVPLSIAFAAKQPTQVYIAVAPVRAGHASDLRDFRIATFCRLTNK